MSEPEPATQYLTQGGQAVYCRNCGKRVGSIVTIEGIKLLDMNGYYWRSAIGSCATCGESFIFTLSDQALTALIERVLQLRKASIDLT